MAQRGARPSISFRRNPVSDRDGIVRRVCGAQAGWAQRRVGSDCQRQREPTYVPRPSAGPWSPALFRIT